MKSYSVYVSIVPDVASSPLCPHIVQNHSDNLLTRLSFFSSPSWWQSYLLKKQISKAEQTESVIPSLNGQPHTNLFLHKPFPSLARINIMLPPQTHSHHSVNTVYPFWTHMSGSFLLEFPPGRPPSLPSISSFWTQFKYQDSQWWFPVSKQRSSLSLFRFQAYFSTWRGELLPYFVLTVYLIVCLSW